MRTDDSYQSYACWLELIFYIKKQFLGLKKKTLKINLLLILNEDKYPFTKYVVTHSKKKI